MSMKYIGEPGNESHGDYEHVCDVCNKEIHENGELVDENAERHYICIKIGESSLDLAEVCMECGEKIAKQIQVL